MSYQALYRVWRPQTFDELVGQTMIAETLMNAVQHQQLSHAYLFTGPRGTGKTSAAKILAKAVNCLNPQNGNPCNECEVCKTITQGQAADVIEIDAASNNGVEEIRDIRDKVRYSPTLAKYKVYIIDEVHMLTTGAFNALLKTLEEPPAHVIFILATTEPHKIPATIISRTQRFDFQRINNLDLVDRMEHILRHNQVKYQIEALEIIARTSNGGMRDSLSLLDQALSYREELTIESALEVSGSVSHHDYVNYIIDIYQNDGFEALKLVQSALQQGKQASRFIEELILFSRDILLSAHTKENNTLLSKEELNQLFERVDLIFYFEMIEQLNYAQSQMRFSNQPDLYLEVMTIQLAQSTKKSGTTPMNDDGQANEIVAKFMSKMHTLEQKVKELERKIESFEVNSSTKNNVIPETPRTRPQMKQQEYHFEKERVYDVLDQATRAHIERLKQVWSSITDNITPQVRVKFSGTTPLAAGPGIALISFKNPAFCGAIQNDQQVEQLLHRSAAEQLGEPTVFIYILESEWQSVRNDYKLLREKNGGRPLKNHEPDLIQKPMDTPLESKRQMENNHDLENQFNPEPELSMGESSEVENITSIQDAFTFHRSNTDERSNEAEIAPEEDNIPKSVSKAIELFGEENINIFYDR